MNPGKVEGPGESFIQAEDKEAFEGTDFCELNLNGPYVPKLLIWKHKGFRSQKWHLETNFPLYCLVIALGYESFSKELSRMREVFLGGEKTAYTWSGETRKSAWKHTAFFRGALQRRSFLLVQNINI